MRILYLHPNAWVGEYAMLARLRQLGHDVFVLEEARTKDRVGRGARWVVDHFHNPGDGITTLWYDPHRGAEKLLTFPVDRLFKRNFDGRNLGHRMWMVAAAVRRFRPDVVVASDGFTYAIPAAFLKRLGLLGPRLVASYIGGDIMDCPEYDYGKRRTPIVSWLIRNSLAGVDVMRALCDSLERILIKEGADPARIAVWPIQMLAAPEVPAAAYARRAELRLAVRARYGMAPDAPLVITLSGNHKGKGMQHLAQAWPAVCAAVPGARWLLCGPDNPWLNEAVRPVLAAAGLANTVAYSGVLRGAEVYEHLAAADLHVNPTLCEGLNMATVDAAAVGVPSVSSDAAGISDYVREHGAGLVVPAADVPALAEAVIAALTDTGRRLTWQTCSRTMAGYFSPERIADGLLRLFGGAASPA
jgi:glycosyltransferase involved in cell wall biosynthesis